MFIESSLKLPYLKPAPTQAVAMGKGGTVLQVVYFMITMIQK